MSLAPIAMRPGGTCENSPAFHAGLARKPELGITDNADNTDQERLGADETRNDSFPRARGGIPCPIRAIREIRGFHIGVWG